MKTPVLSGFAAALLLGTSVVLAQATTDEHAGHHPEGAPSSPAAAQPPAPGMGAAAMPQMQDNMKKMQDLMAKIHASKDGAERRQLMQQHSKAMQEQMAMMHSMGGGMAGGGAGGMMMGGANAAPNAQRAPQAGDGMMNQMMSMHQAMQGRMSMMEMMMGQMMQHQEAMEDPKPAK